MAALFGFAPYALRVHLPQSRGPLIAESDGVGNLNYKMK
jgi:hypothetical protein